MDNSLHKKYWEAESSLEDEARLHREMEGQSGPDAAYFAMLAEMRRQKSRLTLEDIHAYNQRQQQQVPTGGKVFPLYRRLAVAAAILLLIASGFGLWQYRQQSTGTDLMAETYEDPYEAYEEVRKALAFVSTKINRTESEAISGIKKAGEYVDIFK